MSVLPNGENIFTSSWTEGKPMKTPKIIINCIGNLFRQPSWQLKPEPALEVPLIPLISFVCFFFPFPLSFSPYGPWALQTYSAVFSWILCILRSSCSTLSTIQRHCQSLSKNWFLVSFMRKIVQESEILTLKQRGHPLSIQLERSSVF